MHRISLAAILFCVCAWADGAAGLRWTAPGAWKNDGTTRPMRAATYAVPATAGDPEAGECVAYFFGQNQGGSVDANIQRWSGQFEGAKPQVNKKTAHGLPVTMIDMSGTYTGMGGPMAKSKTAKPGYRLLGAIVEGPQGSVFFKFTGPAKTVAANKNAFDKMIDSLNR